MPDGIRALLKLHIQDRLSPRVAPSAVGFRGLQSTINHELLMKYILGIDLAKDKFDCCLLEGEKKFVSQFSNNQRGFKQLWAWLQKQEVAPATMHACMESTGIYGQALAAFLFAKGCALSQVNPAQIKYYAKSRLARNKTDRVDAFIIAAFCRSQAPRLWKPAPPALAQLRALNRLMQARKDQLSRERIRSASLPAFLSKHSRRMIRWLEGEIRVLQGEMDQLIKAHPELAAKRELLCSIPGVGAITAQTILAELPSDIPTAREAAAYAGLTPQQNQSGTKEGRSRLSKTGNPHLRKALYLPAVSARTGNGRLKSLAERLKAKEKTNGAIIGACMHLLLRLCFGVLASGRPYAENWRGRKCAKQLADIAAPVMN